MHSIRSLHRGLKALEVLNDKKTITVADMARELELPRTTTNRILENLCVMGYLRRDEETNLYGLTIRVRNLAVGYNDEAWLSEIVQPLTVELSKSVIWPISIMTPRFANMSLRFTTDSSSPMAIDYYKKGTSLPILKTASGNVYLAYCCQKERELVISTLQQRAKNDEIDKYALANNLVAITNIINRVREQGFAVNLRSPRSHEPGKTSTIAVPIIRDGNFLASLAMRYIDSALSVADLRERYLPILLEYAKKMEMSFKQ